MLNKYSQSRAQVLCRGVNRPNLAVAPIERFLYVEFVPMHNLGSKPVDGLHFAENVHLSGRVQKLI